MTATKTSQSRRTEMSRRERLCLRSIPVLLLAALALTPVIYDPHGVDHFRLVKVVLSQIIIAMMLTCSLVVMLERRGRNGPQNPEVRNSRFAFLSGGGVAGRMYSVIARALNALFPMSDSGVNSKLIGMPMLFLLLTGILSAVFSTNHALSVNSVVNLFLFVSLYFVIIHYVPRRYAERFLVVILLTGAINGLYCVLQFVGLDPLFVIGKTGLKGGRMASSGFIGNPNTVGGFLAGVVPLSLSAILLRRPAWMPFLGVVSLGGIGLGIGFNQTVTAAVSAVFSIFVFFFALFLGPGHVKRKMIIGIAVAGVAISIFVGASQPLKHRFAVFKARWSRTNWNLLASNRPFIWWLTVKMIEDRPLLGSGLGTFPYRVFSYQAFMLPRLSPDSPIYPISVPLFMTPHNEYLQIGAEAGIPGMVAAGWLLAAIFLLGWRSIRKFRRHPKDMASRGSPSLLDDEEIRHEYLLTIGFACTVLVSALESLAHFYFHIAPSALLAVTALGMWEVILKNPGDRGAMADK